MNKKLFTVWVGGVEVNDHYLTLEQSEELAREYELDGYDDVRVDIEAVRLDVLKERRSI